MFTFSGLSWTAQAPIKATITATTLTVSWNCKNFAILSYTLRPHITAFTILLKLSSVNIISDASFATSVPAIPYYNTKTIIKFLMNKMNFYDNYHGKSNISFFQGRTIISAITSHCHYFTTITHFTVNYTLDQCIFICRR